MSYGADLGSMPSLRQASTDRGLVGSRLMALGSVSEAQCELQLFAPL